MVFGKKRIERLFDDVNVQRFRGLHEESIALLNAISVIILLVVVFSFQGLFFLECLKEDFPIFS